MSIFSDMSLAELKEQAKERKIRGTSTMKKLALVEVLENFEKEKHESAAKTTKENSGAKAKTDNVKKVTAKKEELSIKDEKPSAKKEAPSVKKEAQLEKEEKLSIKEEKLLVKEEKSSVKEDVHSVKEEAPVKEEETHTSKEEASIIKNKVSDESVADDVIKSSTISERKPEYGKTVVPSVRKPVETIKRAPLDTEKKAYGNQQRYTNTQNSASSENSNQVKSEQHLRQENNQQRIDYSDLNRLISQPGVPMPPEIEQMDSKETKEGILEVMSDGYGFIRCDNFLPGENDVYVAPIQIRRLNLKTGDIIVGNTRVKNQNEKFSALLYIKSVNGLNPIEALKRPKFEELTPIFPNKRIHLESPGGGIAMRMVDLVSPIGKGQRGMIVSQPKAGKTTLLKQMAKAITKNHPDMHMIILLIDERPEEVTDIKESIEGKSVEVIYSTFDELPENHKRVSEMVIERAKRLVEHKKDVIILLDSITRLARAYNLTVQASGRTLSGGLDPAALHMPKKFFGAARNMRESGSLTILATALVETGSRMDDVVYEEFKGTGNMEITLDRSLSEKRIFPAIDLPKSSTRRDDLLLSKSETEANYLMRKAFNSLRSDDSVERIIQLFMQTKNNNEFIELIKKTKIIY